MTTETSVGFPVTRGRYWYDIPADARSGMRVPARVYADATLWEQISKDRSLDQLLNVATLQGVAERVYAMPDVHEGYGFPVGGVAAMDARTGVISPGGVGYDINCGVRLLATELEVERVRDRVEALVHDLSRSIPSGTGRSGRMSLSAGELGRVLNEGCRYLVRRGEATEDDLEVIEAHGSLARADADAVSDRAKTRGHDQLGTIGSGNHFLEVQVVDAVLDEEAARLFGLRVGQLVVLVHTGSRGLGHQVCTDYVRLMDQVMPQYGITLPDRELACAPLRSPEGQRYFGAMCAAANFAFANRQIITHRVRCSRAFGPGRRAGRVRRGAQHGEARGARRAGAVRAPQGRHPRVRPPSPRDPATLPRGRAARVHPGQHGHGLVGAGGNRRQHGAELREHLPRRGARDEPPRREARQGRRRSAARARVARHRGALRGARRPGRGSPVRVQGRRARGRRRA
jgi:tRNA-splicing ligase RtcB